MMRRSLTSFLMVGLTTKIKAKRSHAITLILYTLPRLPRRIATALDLFTYDTTYSPRSSLSLLQLLNA